MVIFHSYVKLPEGIAWIMLKPMVIPRDPVKLTCHIVSILCEHMSTLVAISGHSGLASPVPSRVISLKGNWITPGEIGNMPFKLVIPSTGRLCTSTPTRCASASESGLDKGTDDHKKPDVVFLQQVKSCGKCPANPSKCTKFPQDFLGKQKLWRSIVWYVWCCLY